MIKLLSTELIRRTIAMAKSIWPIVDCSRSATSPASGGGWLPSRKPMPLFPPRLPTATPKNSTAHAPRQAENPPAHAMLLRDVRFAAYGPYRVQPSRSFVLDVWAFNPELKAEVEREATRQGRVQALGNKGPLAVEVGRTLTVSVSAPSFRVEPVMDTVVWDGRIANAWFTLCSETEARPGAQVGTATITSDGVPIATVRLADR